MQRIKLTLEYDGTDFYGWQAQNALPTIQKSVEIALKRLFNQEISVFVAGRTDKGVHAISQVAHFDVHTTREYSERRIKLGINSHLRPDKISVLQVEFVNNDFHARFSVTQKSYIYKIINRSSPLTFQKGYAWQIIKKLDIEKIRATSQFLLGSHDFLSFRGPDCQSHTTIRTIDNIIIDNNKEEINIEFQAKSFLHNQIRIMVGTLKKISAESSVFQPDEISKIIEKKQRSSAGETAPSCGLFLNWIKYKEIS